MIPGQSQFPMRNTFKADGMPEPGWQNKVTYATPTPTAKPSTPITPRMAPKPTPIAPKPTPKIYVGGGPLGGGMLGGSGGGAGRRDFTFG